MKRRHVLRELRNGAKHGYPLCCVVTYALGILLGAGYGAKRRGVIDHGAYRYVPCRYCAKRSRHWRPIRIGRRA